MDKMLKIRLYFALGVYCKRRIYNDIKFYGDYINKR